MTQYTLPLTNTPGFGVNSRATQAEQEAAFSSDPETGINQHGYSGLSTSQEVLRAIDNKVPISQGVIMAGNQLIGEAVDRPSLLHNLPNPMSVFKGRPVWDYSSTELIESFSVYKYTRARVFDPLVDLVESDEYDFWICALPPNVGDATIAWKDTYRSQISMPPESMLIMILADTTGDFTSKLRIQIYDDGAGEYLFDFPVGAGLAAGNQTNLGNTSGARGPFVLPSPVAIVKPGLVTVTMSNVRTVASSGNVVANMGLVFAVPKKCRAMNASPARNPTELDHVRGLVTG